MLYTKQTYKFRKEEKKKKKNKEAYLFAILISSLKRIATANLSSNFGLSGDPTA